MKVYYDVCILCLVFFFDDDIFFYFLVKNVFWMLIKFNVMKWIVFINKRGLWIGIVGVDGGGRGNIYIYKNKILRI